MLAVPYSRVSTETQLTGRGLARQASDVAAYCQQRGWSLYEGPSYTDSGVSAFGGANITEGALGRFISDVKAGRFGPEPVALLIEDLDRFSRQHPLAILPVLVDDLIGAGVTISQMERGRDISTETIRANQMELHELLLQLGSSHEFSKRLSARVSDVQADMRNRIRSGEVVKPDSAPVWLSLVDGQWQFNDYADVIRRIIQMAQKGLGCFRIAQQLNADEIPSPGQVRRNRWQQGTTKHTVKRQEPYRPVLWSSASVQRLLMSPAMVGHRVVQKPGQSEDKRRWSEECARLLRQGVKKRDLPKAPVRQFLEPERDYYPALMTEVEQAALREAMKARNNLHTGRSDQHHWIGMRLTHCFKCGGVVTGRVSKRKGYTDKYIACKGKGGIRCGAKWLPLKAVQTALLTRLSGDALASLVDGESTGAKASATAAALAEVARAQTELTQIDAAIAAGSTVLNSETDPAVLALLARRQVEQEAKRTHAVTVLALAQRELASLQSQTPLASLCSDVQQEVKTLLHKFAADLDTPEDREDVTRLMRRIGLRIVLDLDDERIGLAIADGELRWEPMAFDVARMALDLGGTDLKVGAHGTASFEAPDEGHEREP
jgi:DNA invertase Pin-like site-specific DNA recombinase